MATLCENIKAMHKELSINDFTTDGTILIGTNEAGEECIVSWNHPTIPQPTEEELAAFIQQVIFIKVNQQQMD